MTRSAIALFFIVATSSEGMAFTCEERVLAWSSPRMQDSLDAVDANTNFSGTLQKNIESLCVRNAEWALFHTEEGGSGQTLAVLGPCAISNLNAIRRRGGDFDFSNIIRSVSFSDVAPAEKQDATILECGNVPKQ